MFFVGSYLGLKGNSFIAGARAFLAALSTALSSSHVRILSLLDTLPSRNIWFCSLVAYICFSRVWLTARSPMDARCPRRRLSAQTRAASARRN
jgi:hypothetical protein